MESKIDWKKEKEDLANEWFKAQVGSTKIKILSGGEEYTSEFKDDVTGEVKTIPKVLFDIEVDGKKYRWGVPKGKGKASLFGQLAMIGATRSSIEGAEITLIAKGEGKQRDYTIPEALNLNDVKEEKVV